MSNYFLILGTVEKDDIFLANQNQMNKYRWKIKLRN